MKRPAKKAKPAKRKRSSPEPDFNQAAHHLVQMSTEEKGPVEVVRPVLQSEISRVMAELGRRGGKIGGAARAAGMTPERRREIALRAARKRWDK
jgi:hypothetical protein